LSWIFLQHAANSIVMKTYLRALFLVAFTVFAVGSMMPAPATAASVPDDGMTAMAHSSLSECLDCSDRGEVGTAGCNLICAAGGFVTVPEFQTSDLRQARRLLRRQAADVIFSDLHWLPLRSPPRPFI
jgi:hypothetical protein